MEHALDVVEDRVLRDPLVAVVLAERVQDCIRDVVDALQFGREKGGGEGTPWRGIDQRGKHWPFDTNSRSGVVSVMIAENGLVEPTPGMQMTRLSVARTAPTSGIGGGKMLSCWYLLLTRT